MNKLFKHTKKLVLLALTVVMMLATSMAVIAADTNYSGPRNLANLEVGTVTIKDGAVKYDGDGTRNIKKPSAADATLYTNGLSTGTTLPGTDLNEASMYYPEEVDFEVDALISTGVKQYTQGEFTAKSSDESVATVKVWNPAEHDGKQGITVYAGDKAGTATIKLVEKYPENPLKPKKSVTFKVTVKTLVDSITFDSNVVKEVEDIWTGEVVKVVEAGKGGSVTLGTTTNKASKTTLKYVIDKKYSSYITVNAKGVLTAKKSTADVEEGYIDVRVVAQDQNYTYDLEKNGNTTSKKGVWGKNETIRVYVNEPTVKSVKVVNVPSALNGKKEEINKLYAEGTGKQSYQNIELKTNLSSNKRVFKLQTEAYSESNWKGNLVKNALTYTSSNAKIASVDANGVITANGVGTAKITIIPADGVKLAKNDVFTLTVKVTTDFDNIEIASTDVTTFTSKPITIKAKANAGVVAKDGKIEFAFKEADSPELESHFLTKNKETSIKKGSFTSDVEGTVTVVAYSVNNPTVKKEVKITFVNQVTKINAMVTSINEKTGKANEKSKAITLYVDRAEVEDVFENDVCDVRVEVTKKNVATPIKSIDGLGFKATSSNSLVADVVENGDTYQIIAKEKGSAKITIEAQDGSKQKAVINVTVKQKVRDITVANTGKEADEQFVILAPNNKGVTTTTFAATVNAGAAATAVDYTFDHSDVFKAEAGENYAKLLTVKSGKTITLSADGNAAVASYIKDNGKILLGTLTVKAKDGVALGISAVDHVAKVVKVNVYAVDQIKYVDEIEGGLAGLVDKMSVSEGLTIGTKDKLDLAALLSIPAEVTDRTVKWEVPNAYSTFLTVNAKGLVTVKTKLTGPGEWAEVNAKMMGKDGQYVVAPIKIRVIDSQKDFTTKLNDQITTLVKENVYTWLGGKPTFNKAKGIVSVTISDVEMGREQANAAMRAKLENLMKVFKDAAKAIITNTSTDYTGITVVDSTTGKEWKLDKVGSKVVVSVDGVQQGGAYSALDVDKAIGDLAGLITVDMDDLVEWANKSLSVKLTAKNTAAGFDTFDYVSDYKVEFTLKDADIENFLDAKVAKAAEKLFGTHKDAAGVYAATYDAASNTTKVDIYDNTLKIADVYAIVKDDAVAAMEDIFAHAQKATVYVVAPGVEPYSETYRRGTNSDVNNLVESLYTKLDNKLLGDTTKELEGTRIYATVDFVFGTKTYSKTYVVSIARTMAAIDANVDSKVNADFVTEDGYVIEDEFATYTYDEGGNIANIAIHNGALTFEAPFVEMVNGFVENITSDASATKVIIKNGDTKKEVDLATGSVTASDLFCVLNPALEASEDMSAEVLNNLVGTSATVQVDYVVNNNATSTVSLEYTVNVGVDLIYAESNVDFVLYDAFASMVEETLSVDSVITAADFDSYEKKGLIYVSDSKVDANVDLGEFFATLLTAAKDNSGKSAVITVGANNYKVALTDTVDLGSVTYKELIENATAIEITIEFLDGQTLTYKVNFESIATPGTAENPIRVNAGTFEQKFAAGQAVNYYGYLDGLTLVVTGENASIDVITGQDDEGNDIIDSYVAGDAIALTGGFYNPTKFVIKNAGDAEATFKVEITYPLGTYDNPEVIENAVVEKEFEAGNDGYYYKWIAEEDGTVTFDISQTEGAWQYQINNEVAYKYGDWYTSLDEDVKTSEVWEVKAGDVLTIMVGTYAEGENPWDVVPNPAGKVAFTVTFKYPVGSERNPQVLEASADYKELPVNNQGYYYTWTAEADGTFTFDISYTTNGWQYQINNETTGVNGSLRHSDDETPVASEVLDVKAGDVYTIMVGTYDPSNPEVNPAGAVEFTAVFAYPLGTELNPIMPTELEFEKEFAADEELYFQGRFAGMNLTVTGENAYVVYEGRTYQSGETIAFPAGGRMMPPVVWVIGNAGDTAATYSVVIAPPVGTIENPEVLKATAVSKELEEGNQNYYYTWIAEEAGTFTFDISGTTGGWQYVINNLTQYEYGYNRCSEDKPVVASEKWEVEAGDEIVIMVGTFDPANFWLNPAGTVDFTVSFEAK